jgi:D-glycero-D-manno-heptose 1,7-bisphosphate phosphatase
MDKAKNKAIFLDRDGVINRVEGHYYVYKISDWLLTPNLCDALKLLQQQGFMLIVITNQGGIAKGEYSIADVENLHKYMQAELMMHNVCIDAIYCCPHHEIYGKCLCRKPQPLLLQKAAQRFNIDLKQSYFIGDSQRDMEAAAAAAVSGIHVQTDKGILKIAQEICKIKH